MTTKPEAELRSAGVTYLVLGLLAYAFLAYRAHSFLDDGDVEHTLLFIVLLVPAVATALGALIGWSSGHRAGQGCAYALVVAGLWLLTTTALVLAAAVATLIYALSSWTPA